MVLETKFWLYMVTHQPVNFEVCTRLCLGKKTRNPFHNKNIMDFISTNSFQNYCVGDVSLMEAFIYSK